MDGPDLRQVEKEPSQDWACKDRWHAVVSAAADWYWESDASGRFSYISGGLARCVGSPGVFGMADDCLGSFGAETAPWEAQIGLAGQRAPFDDMALAICHEGRRLHFLLSGRPFIGPDGEFAGFRGLARQMPGQANGDWHGGRVTDAMFRAVADAAFEAIAIYSEEGNALYSNPAYRQMFGREPHSTRELDHYSEAAKRSLFEEVAPALQEGKSWEGMHQAFSPDGELFPLRQRIGVFADANGDPQCFFSVMQDQSSQARIESELFRAKEAAEQANRAKTRFLAVASHDLRQPLQALSMFVSVLASRDHRPEDSALIGRIEDSVAAVETLLNGLLDVSKLEAGLVKPVLASFTPLAMLSRLAGEFTPLAADAGIEFRWVASNLPIHSDPVLLERILRNLLNNAIRYTPKGRILLGCRRRKGCLRFEVRDTGIGIPSGELDNIFREFHQLANSSRDRHQGLGLGLAIVERLCKLLEHEVSVSSELGLGSCFAVEVTLAEPLREPVPIARPAAPPRQRQATLLVIEDEPTVRESMRLLLESWNYRVLAAADCAEAVVCIGEARPDLILADYRLGGGATGTDAIDRVRAGMGKALPAIILTGDTAPERLRQAKASGHRLLHKPVQPAILRKLIDEALCPQP